MDALTALIDGFATAADPDQPAVRLHRRAARHRDRRAARHRPGDGDRAAAAGDLRARARRRRSSCSPASTTAACTAARPPRSCSTPRVRARRWSPPSRATRWPEAGRAAPALATAAIGSFIAGTIGTLCLALLAPLIVKLAVEIGAPDYFAVMVLAFVAVTTVLGSSRVRGFAVARHRADHRPGRHRPD